MLVLSRRSNETIHIGDDIVITVVRVQGDKVRIGIDAPTDVRVMRGELLEQEASPKTEGSEEAAGLHARRVAV